jgi:hypothetical protein
MRQTTTTAKVTISRVSTTRPMVKKGFFMSSGID